MLTLLGALIAITFTAWLSTRSVHAMIDALRHETRADLAGMRASFAEVRTSMAELRTSMADMRGELKLDILRIENKLDHYAETQASHSERIDRLERR
jgi:septal ring factor EnvC (AmiA/AmiB activator)